MYKKKNNTRLRNSKRLIYWFKKKALTIITAFMLGISNAINDDDKSNFDNQHKIARYKD
jgi:hypothetical protein